MKTSNAITACLATLALAACGGGGGGGGPVAGPAPNPPPDNNPPPPPPPVVGFKAISGEAWDETAVRQVLHAFAYGGQATDVQIRIWADMPPAVAINEMFTFAPHNAKLSPLASSDSITIADGDGTLRWLSDFWASDDPDNGVFQSLREFHIFPSLVWPRATLTRGLNPFRQKVGLWETNYHLSVNQRAGLNDLQIIRYYDDILNALSDNKPYQDVLATAAASSAIARQYGHFGNFFVNGVCFCNEDFAREYHQLFFGILGDYDTDYHETVTIKNTAKALTDMQLGYDPDRDDFSAEITYGLTYHAPGALDILQNSIGGSDANERLSLLSQIAIEHPESLANLPVKIIQGLADDSLDAEELRVIREAWDAQSSKDLLAFLRSYAISETFHSPTRVKLRTSADRQLTIGMQLALSNADVNLDLYMPWDLEEEDVVLFSPRHNVFGAQTPEEAANSSQVFRNNFNRVTENSWRFRAGQTDHYGYQWTKDWSAAMSRPAAGYTAKAVAEWLWQRFVGDGLANFGPLERAHVYAILARDRDLTFVVNFERRQAAGQDPNDVSAYDLALDITSADLSTDSTLVDLVAELGATTVNLDSSDATTRLQANERVGQAVNFISGTPFVFALQGASR